MTKDEMVQRLYIQYLTVDYNGCRESPQGALMMATAEADYFFEFNKPKKKREVYYVNARRVPTEWAQMTHSGMKMLISEDDMSMVGDIIGALLAGKSVRLKK